MFDYICTWLCGVYVGKNWDTTCVFGRYIFLWTKECLVGSGQLDAVPKPNLSVCDSDDEEDGTNTPQALLAELRNLTKNGEQLRRRTGTASEVETKKQSS